MEETMNPKNVFITLLIGLFALSISGMTIDELRQETEAQFGSSITKAVDGAEQAAESASGQQLSKARSLFDQFLNEEHPLNQIEQAARLWQDIYPEGYQSWLETKTSDPSSNLKFFYLWFLNQEDALSKINAGRQLITNYPDQVYGYRLMFITYLEHFPLENYFDDPDDIAHMLETDQKYFMDYFQKFPTDEYHRLAGIYALNAADRHKEACEQLTIAFENDDVWLGDIDIDRMEPLSEYHELLFCLAKLIAKAEFPEKYSQLYEYVASMLTSYYFEVAPDYERVVTLLDVSKENVIQYYYDRFALIMSLYKTGRLQKAGDMLISNQDYFEPIEFQNVWMMYEQEATTELYQACLKDRKEPIARFLYTRSIPDEAGIVTEGRKLVSELPQSKYGYQLLADIYWQHFAQSRANDPQRTKWEEMLASDTSKLKAANIRFSEEPWALQGYLLSLIIGKKTEQAQKYYQTLLERDITSDIISEADRIIANTGNLDFLWNALNIKIGKYVEHEIVPAEEQHLMTAFAYCYTLYENEDYGAVTDAIHAHPDWLENVDIQYMAVNSHYQLKEYDQTIDLLNMMVGKSTIGINDLLQLADLPISQHPNWQALIDYAAQLNPEEPLEEPEQEDFQVRLAPDWTLPDAEGNLVSLQDLRGKIVILDFWATWCNPCQKSMPLIDQWMREEMPINVAVFSINVFEENRSDAIKFMNKNNYSMQLLFGDDEVTEAYGVEGIPYICIIDPEGNIRAEELGFSPYLKDKLTTWVNEIRY